MKMKTKTWSLLGFLMLMSACGANKGRISEQSGANTSSVVTTEATEGKNENEIQLKNLIEPGSHFEKIAPGFRIIGVFDKDEFPAEILEKRNDGAIGTLDLEIQEEIYQSQYNGPVLPTKNSKILPTSYEVVAFIDRLSPKQVALAVRSEGEELNSILNHSQTIEVESNPQMVCMKIFIPKQTSIAYDQWVDCTLEGFCRFYWSSPITSGPGNFSVWVDRSVDQIKQGFSGVKCEDHKIYRTKTSQQQRMIATRAAVNLNANTTGLRKKLIFVLK